MSKIAESECLRVPEDDVWNVPRESSVHQFFFFFSTSQSYWLAYTDASAWSKSWVFKRHFQHNSGRWVTGYISIIDVISSRFHSSKAVWHFSQSTPLVVSQRRNLFWLRERCLFHTGRLYDVDEDVPSFYLETSLHQFDLCQFRVSFCIRQRILVVQFGVSIH